MGWKEEWGEFLLSGADWLTRDIAVSFMLAMLRTPLPQGSHQEQREERAEQTLAACP